MDCPCLTEETRGIIIMSVARRYGRGDTLSDDASAKKLVDIINEINSIPSCEHDRMPKSLKS